MPTPDDKFFRARLFDPQTPTFPTGGAEFRDRTRSIRRGLAQSYDTRKPFVSTRGEITTDYESDARGSVTPFHTTAWPPTDKLILQDNQFSPAFAEYVDGEFGDDASEQPVDPNAQPAASSTAKPFFIAPPPVYVPPSDSPVAPWLFVAAGVGLIWWANRKPKAA
jgi:hypothetical protein